jgi:hypothetical protein
VAVEKVTVTKDTLKLELTDGGTVEAPLTCIPDCFGNHNSALFDLDLPALFRSSAIF